MSPIRVAGRLTLPANEIARVFAEEYGKDDAQFDFVYYIEGQEREERAVESTVDAFIETPTRSKWSFHSETGGN